MTSPELTPNERHDEARADLAAAFRWTARLGMHEGIANHFSYMLSDDPCQFLVNPYGIHFSRMKASDLLVLDANNPKEIERDDVDPTAFSIHGAIHRAVPHARCIMHVHSKYATVLASLKEKTMLPIDQNTARFFERTVIDNGFDGMGLEDEAERLASTLSNKPIVLMGNHGFMAIGENIARTFDEMYYFERSCETFITALSTGRDLHILSDDIARKTALQWESYLATGSGEKHLSALRNILDHESQDYKS